jgi:GMP synthase-like glutamine amidotransferase
MKRAVVLKHVVFEAPGRIADLLADRGYALDVRELYRGDAVPGELERGDVLVVMGGPMGVSGVGSVAFPFLRRELDLLARCIEQDAPVLGVCLGAQLLAAAADADVHPMVGSDGARVYEVGWAATRFHRTSDADAVLDGVPDAACLLHWHGDMFELPRGARRLASTGVCLEQGFQLGTRQFGLQA